MTFLDQKTNSPVDPVYLCSLAYQVSREFESKEHVCLSDSAKAAFRSAKTLYKLKLIPAVVSRVSLEDRDGASLVLVVRPGEETQRD
jgi:hypothetical protein